MRPDVVLFNQAKGNGKGNWAQRRFDFSVNRQKQPRKERPKNPGNHPGIYQKEKGASPMNTFESTGLFICFALNNV